MDFKKLKQEMETVFNTISEAALAGDPPKEDDASLLLRLSRQMHSMADEAWETESEDFSHLANQLLHAVKKGETQDAIMIVESLNDAQSYCHQTFRL